MRLTHTPTSLRSAIGSYSANSLSGSQPLHDLPSHRIGERLERVHKQSSVQPRCPRHAIHLQHVDVSLQVDLAFAARFTSPGGGPQYGRSSLLGGRETAEALLSLVNLGLTSIQTISEPVELGAEVRAHHQGVGAAAGSHAVDVGANCFGSKAGGDHRLDLLDPSDVLFGVDPVTVGVTVRNEDTAILIVPQGAGAQPRPGGKIADQHFFPSSA